MTLRIAILAIGLLTLVSCAGEPTNPDKELPEYKAFVTGTILDSSGAAPEPGQYEPYGYVYSLITEGTGCGQAWEGNSANRLESEDGSWLGSISFWAVRAPFIEDSVCTHVVLLPPPTSPWRADTISVGALVVRQEPPYDSAEAHFILKPKEDTAASR